jgi:hypothetical protein
VYAKGPGDVARGKIHGSVDIGLSVISTKAKRKRLDIDAEEFIYHLKVSVLFVLWFLAANNLIHGAAVLLRIVLGLKKSETSFLLTLLTNCMYKSRFLFYLSVTVEVFDFNPSYFSSSK